jgi:hypothetical protein
MSQSTVQEAVVLTDADGNYYLLTQDLIQAGRIPPDRAAALEQALIGQDISGYFFDFTKINLARVEQANLQAGQNIVAGAFLVGAAQTIAQLAATTGSITQT